jgi:hypothetical protein
VPHNGGSLDGDGGEKRDDVSGELVDAVAATRPLRVAETSLIEDECMKPSRQERDDSAEREPGVWPAVQKDHRFAIAVAMLCVVDLRAIVSRTVANCKSVIDSPPDRPSRVG